MGMFDNLNTAEPIAVEEDSIGGFAKIDKTGAYDFVVDQAYGGQSKGGAFFIKLRLKAENGATLNMTEYITSGSEKGTRPYYIDKTTGKQRPLPGYSKINSLDVLLTGNAGQYPATENKTIMIWNKEANKEVPTPAEVVTGWIGKPITALVKINREFKQAKNAAGDYVDTTETRDFAEVEHFVDPVTHQTRNEKIAGKTTDLIHDQFLERFAADYVADRTKSKNKDGAPAAGTSTPPPADSPFGTPAAS